MHKWLPSFITENLSIVDLTVLAVLFVPVSLLVDVDIVELRARYLIFLNPIYVTISLERNVERNRSGNTSDMSSSTVDSKREGRTIAVRKHQGRHRLSLIPFHVPFKWPPLIPSYDLSLTEYHREFASPHRQSQQRFTEK